MNWIAYAAAVALAAAALALFWDGLSGISDLGLTADSAIALTSAGAIAVGLGVALAAFLRRGRARSEDSDRAPRDKHHIDQ